MLPRSATPCDSDWRARRDAAQAAFAGATASLSAARLLRPCAAALATVLATLGAAQATSVALPLTPCVTTTHDAQRGRAPPRSPHGASVALVLPRWRRPPPAPPDDGGEQRRRAVLEEAYQVLHDHFVDEKGLNWARLRRGLRRRSVGSDEKLERSLDWLLSRCEDPFTRYLTAPQLQSMKDDIDGEVSGVGVVLGAEAVGWRRARRMVVKHVVRNSPAHHGGLRKGDSISAIDMHEIGHMSVHEASGRLAGQQGRKVLVSFWRDGTQISVLLTRRRVQVPTVWAQRVAVRGVGTVGYVQLREFAAHTAREMRRAVRTLERDGGVALYVLDMRGNSGGLVDGAVQVAKLFLRRRQVVVRFAGRGGMQWAEQCGGGPVIGAASAARQQPVVVLVDGATASASELVAGALRDNCRAVMVGRATFGKGSVQAITPLSNGGAVAVTVARYRTPRGGAVEVGHGLEPNERRVRLGSGERAVAELFDRAPGRRLRWIDAQLKRCSASGGK